MKLTDLEVELLKNLCPGVPNENRFQEAISNFDAKEREYTGVGFFTSLNCNGAITELELEEMAGLWDGLRIESARIPYGAEAILHIRKDSVSLEVIVHGYDWPEDGLADYTLTKLWKQH